MKVSILIVSLLLATTTARADDALAKKFLNHIPNKLKDFDPVTDALKQDGLKGAELRREAARIKREMGARGVPITAKKNRRAIQPVDHQYSQSIQPMDAKSIRMARAAKRRSMVAQSDAFGMRVVASEQASFDAMVRRMTPHY